MSFLLFGCTVPATDMKECRKIRVILITGFPIHCASLLSILCQSMNIGKCVTCYVNMKICKISPKAGLLDIKSIVI